MALTPAFWSRQTVLLTGHTGFKGGWLALWLAELGARVSGFALPPESPSLFETCRIGDRVGSAFGDIRDPEAVRAVVRAVQPTIVLHLAAQSLVRRSYRAPRETFATNVMGTVNVLEAVRETASVRAVVVATSDKCYLDRHGAAHAEEDPLGGTDPYSASKACTELVCGAYGRSFFAEGAGLATVRAGNVVGGGDWAEDRLLPDAMRALAAGVPLQVRHPHAVRPWQHVLEPLRGYLMLAERLAAQPREWSGAWNFGPDPAEAASVAEVLDLLHRAWGGGEWIHVPSPGQRESEALRLDSSKSALRLGWRPRLTLAETVGLTVRWYRDARAGADMTAVTAAQVDAYASRAEVVS